MSDRHNHSNKRLFGSSSCWCLAAQHAWLLVALPSLCMGQWRHFFETAAFAVTPMQTHPKPHMSCFTKDWVQQPFVLVHSRRCDGSSSSRCYSSRPILVEPEETDEENDNESIQDKNNNPNRNDTMEGTSYRFPTSAVDLEPEGSVEREENQNGTWEGSFLSSTTGVPQNNNSSNNNNTLPACTSAIVSMSSSFSLSSENGNNNKKNSRNQLQLELSWCNSDDVCHYAIRERVQPTENGESQIVLTGPATGQVAYSWVPPPPTAPSQEEPVPSTTTITTHSVLLLIKAGEEHLLQIAAQAVQEWIGDCNCNSNDDGGAANNDAGPKICIDVWLEPSVAARLEHAYGVQGMKGRIHLFEADKVLERNYYRHKKNRNEDKDHVAERNDNDDDEEDSVPLPNLICTLGGDGLLMHAGMLFQGPCPPILSVAGGSLGFLTPFQPDELVDAVRVALGLVTSSSSSSHDSEQDPFHHQSEPGPAEASTRTTTTWGPSTSSSLTTTTSLVTTTASNPSVAFGPDGSICLSIRMRLRCRILNRQGVCRAQFNVLNEVVIDRGSSPYLAALECFCDNHHLTTVQADGIIFATPTGSTAYSMAAGGSVVHPAVPCILVTPICPHVLSFRSMVFPDHVVLHIVVPDDARAEASVAFDGKHRQPLHRGDCIEVSMSPYPVPTINRHDHSWDWLHSLKRNFGFNARPRQRPLKTTTSTSTNPPPYNSSTHKAPP